MQQYYIHLPSTPKLPDPLMAWGIFDRTKTLFNNKNIKSVIDLGVHTTQTFGGICEERGMEIATLAVNTDKKVYVFWSGGIDSTAVLVSLLDKVPLDKLVVVMNNRSVDEYPWFYENFIRGKLTTTLHSFDNYYKELNTFLEDGIVCTGELADQLFGSAIYFEYDGTEVLSQSWENFAPITNKSSLQKLEEFNAKCPMPVRTVKDFLWWFNYAVKYQGNCFRMIAAAPKAVLNQNVFHFFHTKAFNDWAVSTPTEKKFYGVDPKQYKMPAKEYIYTKTRDADYRDNKLKKGSLRIGACIDERIKAIDINWNRYA